MITAQDIREKAFEKARNGYDMATVDDFLEELADEISAAQKENAVLKSKMKVLVDKIEEYRSNEEALNMAILSAQKLAVQIENEARQRASATIADAEAKAQAVLGSAKMLLQTGRHPGELKDMVCSPGGTTIEAVRILEEKGLRSSVIEAVIACARRSQEM